VSCGCRLEVESRRGADRGVQEKLAGFKEAVGSMKEELAALQRSKEAVCVRATAAEALAHQRTQEAEQLKLRLAEAEGAAKGALEEQLKDAKEVGQRGHGFACLL